MGINGLNKLINQYAPDAITQEHISKFRKTKIAIDSELLIHKYRSNDNPNSHIFGFANDIIWYIKNGITPVYVFDGYPTAVKQANVLMKRAHTKEQLYKKIDELENEFVYKTETYEDITELDQEMNDLLDKLIKIKHRTSYIGKNYRNECKYLLKLLGIPFVIANDDAEAFCAIMQLKGIVDHVYTEDTDIIPYIIANYDTCTSITPSKPIKVLRKGYMSSTVTVIDITKIIHTMDMSKQTFIDMCILSGCDFCMILNKIGPSKAYTYMHKYKSIENLSNEIHIPDTFKYQEARDAFFKVNYTETCKSLELGTINEEQLKMYLIDERNISPDSLIERYTDAYIQFYASNFS